MTRKPLKIAIYHEKGGAGKSTLTIALAFELGLPIIDLDARKVSSKYAAAAARDPATLSKDGWIVDYPAGMDLSLASHMNDADVIIVPSHASTFDVEGISQTMKFVMAHAGKQTKICFFGTALSNDSSAEFLREGIAKYGYPLIGYFKHRVVYERSRLSSKPASALNKSAKAEVEATAKALYKYIGVAA
jgi:cellulose biosynthesis protein BcsQ